MERADYNGVFAPDFKHRQRIVPRRGPGRVDADKPLAPMTWVQRFFGSLKRERTYFQTYTTRAQAREDLIDYIEGLYNDARLHSYPDYISPNDFESARVS